MKLFSILFFLFASLTASADAWDPQIALARQQAAAKETGALVTYKSVLNSMPKNDPRVETLKAEQIYLLYSLKKYEETVQACTDFLNTYRQSKVGFNISYVLAAADFGLDRYSDAFAIFASFQLDQIRTLPDDSRQKIYEVLIRSLTGMKKDAASKAFCAEATGLFKDAQGKPLLVGTVESVITQVPDEYTLEAMIDKVGLPSSQRTIRDLLGLTKEESDTHRRYLLALALSMDSAGDPALQQKMVQLRAGMDWDLTAENSGIGFRFDADLMALGSSPAGSRLQALGLTGYLRMALVGKRTGLLLNGYSGLHTRIVSASPASYTYGNLAGAFAMLEVRKSLDFKNSVGLQVFFAPYNVLFGTLTGANYILRLGLDYSFRGAFERENGVFLEWEKLQFGRTEGPLPVSRLTAGYRILF